MFGWRYIALIIVGLLLQFEVVGIQTQSTMKTTKLDTIEKIRQKIDQSPADADVKLFDMVGDFLINIPLPDPAKRIFNKDMVMRNLKIKKDLPASPYIRSGIGFSGSMVFNNTRITATMYVLRDRTLQQQYMLVVEMPNNFKISDMFPSLNALDIFSFPKQTLILSTFDFYGPEGGLLKPGLYFDALLDLSGPLDALRAMKQTARKFDSIIIEEEPIHFWGKIPVALKYKGTSAKDMISVVFGSEIPIRVGMDFRKIRQLPRSVTNTFQKLTTDNFNIKVALHPKLAITLETGVRLTLGTQTDPLRLTGVGVIVPGKNKFALGMRLRNMLELSWLALGNAAFQVDFPGTAGLPIAGLGFFGQIDVGKRGKSRATFKVAGKTEIKKDKDGAVQLPGELEAEDEEVAGEEAIGVVSPLGVFAEVSAENVQIHHVIELLAQMGRKARVLKTSFPDNKIPVMQINKVRGYAALDSVTIANKFYKAGFRLYLDTHFFNQKVLFDVEILHKDLKMSGVGYLSDINFVLKGKPIFSLTGPGLDQEYKTKDDGPVMFCSLNAKYPGATLFGVRGELTVPPIDLRAKTDVVFQGTSFKADIEGEFAGFTGLFSVYINPLNMKDMFIKIGFKRDFDDFLAKQIKIILKKLESSASKKLVDLDAFIEMLLLQLKKGGNQASRVFELKIQEKKDSIVRIKKKIKTLQDQRSKATIADKVKITANIKQQKLLLKKDQALVLALQPAKVGAWLTASAVQVTNELRKARVLRNTAEKTLRGLERKIEAFAGVTKVVRVKEAVGSYSAQDIAHGKLPKLNSLVIQTNFPDMPPKTFTLKNVQFDFKKPVEAVVEIAKSTLRLANII